MEAGSPERRRGAHVGVKAGTGLDRVALDDGRALRTGVLDRRFQQAECHSRPTDPSVEKEADDGPDRRIVRSVDNNPQ